MAFARPCEMPAYLFALVSYHAVRHMRNHGSTKTSRHQQMKWQCTFAGNVRGRACVMFTGAGMKQPATEPAEDVPDATHNKCTARRTLPMVNGVGSSRIPKQPTTTRRQMHTTIVGQHVMVELPICRHEDESLYCVPSMNTPSVGIVIAWSICC